MNFVTSPTLERRDVPQSSCCDISATKLADYNDSPKILLGYVHSKNKIARSEKSHNTVGKLTCVLCLQTCK